MRINARIYRILIKVLIAIVVLVIIGVAIFLGLQISGRNRLYNRSNSAGPNLAMSDLAETVEADAAANDATVAAGTEENTEEETYEWQEGDVRYNGTIYRYNQDILTFLFLGIDKMSKVKPVEDGIDGGQSDAIFLLVMNPHNKEVSVISVPRDTMAEIELYDPNGKFRGKAIQQICLQHGYGDGAWLSCERSVNAVSHFFYDLPIHGYCSINMGAIPLINDAVGGIDLMALEDVKNSSGFNVKEGEELHLDGMDAYHYLRSRDTKVSHSAADRLDRQKQYLTAYAAKAAEVMKSDITLPVTLYNTLSKYMVTNITVDEVSYLATQMADYQFSEEQMYSLQGEITSDGRYEEFHADEEALYELILKVFYEEVN